MHPLVALGFLHGYGDMILVLRYGEIELEMGRR